MHPHERASTVLCGTRQRTTGCPYAGSVTLKPFCLVSGPLPGTGLPRS